MISIGSLAIQLACARPAQRPEPGSTPTAAPAGSEIRPMKLRYHAEHRGDHSPWIYTAHVSVDAESHRGRPVWRRSYRLEVLSSPSGQPDMVVEGATVLDRATMAPLEVRSSFGKVRNESIFRPDRVDGTSVDEDGVVSHTTVPVQGPVVTHAWAGLDLYLLGLPLREGFQRRVAIHYYDDKPLRPFNLAVERIERIRVPAGEFNVFRIRVDPLDGDERMRATYHVRTDGPRVVVRKEYVVNPRTEGVMKRSTGIEELEAIE